MRVTTADHDVKTYKSADALHLLRETPDGRVALVREEYEWVATVAQANHRCVSNFVENNRDLKRRCAEPPVATAP